MFGLMINTFTDYFIWHILSLISLCIYGMTDLTVSGLAVFAIEVGPVAVLVPPGSFVRQGTVSDCDVIVSVFCREGTALVVAQRVTWGQKRGERARERETISKFWATSAYG